MYNDKYDIPKLQNGEKYQIQSFQARVCNSVRQGYPVMSFQQCPINALAPSHSTFYSSLLPRAPNMVYSPYWATGLRYKPFIDLMAQYMGIKTSVFQQNSLSYFEKNLPPRDSNATKPLQHGTYFISRFLTAAKTDKNGEQPHIRLHSCTCLPVIDKHENTNVAKITKTTEPEDEKDFSRYETKQLKTRENTDLRKRKFTDFRRSVVLVKKKKP